MKRQTPQINNGQWARVAPKTHRHESGIIVRYDHKAWAWEIVGGADDGRRYTTLSAAQHFAVTGKVS